FTIKDSNDVALDLTGCTAKFCIGGNEFPAVIDTPATGGIVNANLTPTQTQIVAKGSHRAWCKISSGEDVRAYGNHYIVAHD
ncbi:MAG: hypothetical protein ABIR33_09460, partial [Pyrinomonadaceae bacterium]